MKALLIGGTGTISTEITRLCARKGWEVTLLNRGNSTERVPEGVKLLSVDIHRQEAVATLLADSYFDVVADFIAFTPEDVERDLRLFEGKTGQYFFISSASAYEKPLSCPIITEGTPLHNPYWAYSRNKAACERILLDAWNERHFPVTIIRPSHTYCERGMPVAMHGRRGSFQVLERIRLGKPILVPGDGNTLWTVTHSRDFAVAFEGLMGNIHAIGEVFHITSDESLTWNQIHQCLGNALGQRVVPVYVPSDLLGRLNPDWTGALWGDKSHSVCFDNSKIKRAVPSFHAETVFSRGAREGIAWIYSHPECQRPDPAFDAWCDAFIARWDELTNRLPLYPED